MAIKALVLDLDGTLYSTYKVKSVDRASIPRAHAYLEKRGLLGKIPKRSMLRIDRQIEKGSVSSTIRRLSRRFNLDHKHFNDYVNDLSPKDFGIGKDRRLAGLLSKASKRYKLFIFTNSPEIWARRVITRIGLKKLIPFKNVVCLECMGNFLKPDRESYRIMLRITGMRREEIIFIDDLPQNVAAGTRLGIRSMTVSNTDRNKRNSIYSILECMCKGIK
jgi:FMN phosphatase YigB (HAD superfamily)